MKRSYRLARRSFLAAVGGAFGLKTMLRNLEASANQVASPPRLLVMMWPVGTVHYHFTVTGTGFDYTTSRILQPFEDAGLRDDLIVLYGLSIQGLEVGCGLGALVPVVTGAHSPGTRENGGQPDDSVAGGPSFDQILLQHAPQLQTLVGHASAICDARVDSNETSGLCLSYSYTQRSIVAARQGTECTQVGELMENVPLLPTLRPLDLYNDLFGGFMPGGGDRQKLVQALMRRQSVLDYALDELARLKTLAPASEAPKIDAHAEVIRKVEQQLAVELDALQDAQDCLLPQAPATDLVGEEGSRSDYGNPQAQEADDELHARIGAAHAAILKGAFQCDLVRVATFQWSPTNNHVSFGGLFPDDLTANFMHHPLSHRIGNRNDVLSAPPNDAQTQSVVEFLANVHTWYNTQTAAIVSEFKAATDVFGGNLLDQTIAPFITDFAEATHSRQPLPALVFGGRALGMQGGQALSFANAPRPHADLWLSIAQAYLNSSDPMSVLADEAFDKVGVAPIPGLWLPSA